MIDILLTALFQVAAGEPAPPPETPTTNAAAEEIMVDAPAAVDDRGEPRLKRSCYYERNSSWRFRMQRCETEEVYPGDPGYEDAEPAGSRAATRSD